MTNFLAQPHETGMSAVRTTAAGLPRMDSVRIALLGLTVRAVKHVAKLFNSFEQANVVNAMKVVADAVDAVDAEAVTTVTAALDLRAYIRQHLRHV